MMKKNGKLRVCVDFRDLNAVTTKDMYVMPIVDMLVDSTANNVEGYEQVVYYLSRVLNLGETRYTPIEKLRLTLYFACTKFRH